MSRLRAACRRGGSWRRFPCADHGVSAIEFALILPILIVLFLGGVELSHAISADRKVSSASSSVGDLAAQLSDFSAEIGNAMNAANAIMAPYDASDLTLVVSRVEVNGGAGQVVQSFSNNGSGHAPGSTLSIPAGLSGADELVVAEASYIYRPIIGAFFTNAITLSDTYYLRPRADLQAIE